MNTKSSLVVVMAVLAFSLVCTACDNPTNGSSTDELYIDNERTVVTPTANPAAGAVDSGTLITLSTATGDAEIWYTTDGTTPAKNASGSTKYTTPSP